MNKSKHDDMGYETPDPTPVAVPVGFKREPTIQELIAQFVRSEQLRQHAIQQGMETLEEADDFDVDEDAELVTPHEMVDMQEERPISDIDSLAGVLDEQKGSGSPDVQRPEGVAAGGNPRAGREVRGGGSKRGGSKPAAKPGPTNSPAEAGGEHSGDPDEG